jgi:DNA-binding ferritin-like protein
MLNKGITIENGTSILSNLLADEMCLYLKTGRFLWYVYGISYLELQKFQKDDISFSGNYIYKESEKIYHTVSEASRMHKYISSASDMDENAIIPTLKDTLQSLIDDHAAIIMGLRCQIEKKLERIDHDNSVFFLNSLLAENVNSEKALKGVLI